MSYSKLVSYVVIAGATLGGVSLVSGNPADKKYQEAPASRTVVESAIADGRFKTLVTAIQAAGLVETLNGKGPFTVFAPTDEAFAKIPADQLKALLADKAKLTAVLTYHVVPGSLKAADVAKVKTLKTVEGRSLKVDTKGGVTIGGAKVLVTDVMTSNGVIHAIDTVLVPK